MRGIPQLFPFWVLQSPWCNEKWAHHGDFLVNELRNVDYMGRTLKKFLIGFLTAAMLMIIPAGLAMADDNCIEVTIDGTATSYTNMQDGWNAAYDAAKSGKTVTAKLLADWTGGSDRLMGSGNGFSNGRLAAAGTGLTLDLNGHTLDRALRSAKDDGAVIYIPDGTKLTIVDSAPTEYNYSNAIAGGVITGGWGNNGAGLIDIKNGELVMTGGSLINGATNEDGGAILAHNVSGMNMNISNVRFVGNSTQNSSDKCHGGAIRADGSGTITLYNCSFEDNYSENNGGAIYVEDGITMNITRTTFSGNRCKDNGGAVYSNATGSAIYDDCTFYNNHADGSGGALYTNKDGSTELRDVEMLCNSAGNEGGAWYINAWKTFMYNVKIEENTSSGKGGGVYVDSYYDTNLQGLMIIRNNTSNKEARTSNLFLQTGLGDSSQARFINGGCNPGSEVHYGTDNNGASCVCNEMTEYQLQYFVTDEKSQELAKDSVRTESYSVASIFTDGSLWIIIGGFALMAAAAAVAVIIGVRRKAGQK